MNKNKILYNSQNVYDLIKDNTEIIETDNNVIFTPSAMDIIKSKGIKIVYKKDIADNCGCSCVKDDSTEIVKQTIKILVNKLNITDEKIIKKVIAEVLNRVNSHFTGKGNGDVYADYKYGDYFTIKMIALDKSGYTSLNELERNTIMTYDAFASGYNKTRGNR